MRDILKELFEIADFQHKELFINQENPWDPLDQLDDYLLNQNLGSIEAEIPKGVTLVHPNLITIEKGCQIESGCYIEGPCYLSQGTLVRQGAYIRGGVVTGRNCVIGHCTEVKHSIFLNSSAAPHFNYVGDSIIGNGVNLGAGAVCANLRFDHGIVSITWNESKMKSGRKKLGAIIGDECQIGCNAVLAPGTILGKKSCCYPLIAVRGTHPALSIIKGNVA